MNTTTDHRHRWIASVMVLLVCSGLGAGERVRTVSPGALDEEVEAANACPTFSWTSAPDADGYELALFRVEGERPPEPLYTSLVEGAATSWSPSRAECLAAGGSYAWSVRPLVEGDSPEAERTVAEWAEPRWFRVPGAPSDDEVAAAVAVLDRWQVARYVAAAAPDQDGSPSTPSPRTAGSTTRSAATGESAAARESVVTGVAAVRGEVPDPTGSAFGLLGISHSPDGAGVAARNEAAGADLVLDGEADGATDTRLDQAAVDRSSAADETFDVRNSGAGGMTLQVDGVDVVTTATDQDILAALACAPGEIAKLAPGGWECAADEGTSYVAGNQLELSGATFDVVEGPGSGLDADTVDGLDPAEIAAVTHDHFGQTWTGTGAEGVVVVDTTPTGFVKGLVGRIQSNAGAGVVGEVVGGSGTATGVAGYTDAPFGAGTYGASPYIGVAGDGVIGVRGTALASTENGIGVQGTSASELPNGAGVYGLTSTTVGTAPGVWGRTQSTVGSGVLGEAAAFSGNPSGVRGVAYSSTGAGVYGNAPAFGVAGEATSPTGIGVKGLASAASGNATGVAGFSSSPTGAGVYGTSPTLGVAGAITADGGIGVRGIAGVAGGSSDGVRGELTAGEGAAIHGVNSSAFGLAGLFDGTVRINGQLDGRGTLYGNNLTIEFNGSIGQNLVVSGNLSKASGSFRIDHPLDPERKYLLHSFVESPDMMNVYNGNVTLDGNGEAWVGLPEWFEALNRDFRYQLTPIGAWAACWIAEEVDGNRFLIRGDPDARVSWQVTGIRHDRWADAHRIPVEQLKPPKELGTYLHPEEWGQPADPGAARQALEPIREATAADDHPGDP